MILRLPALVLQTARVQTLAAARAPLVVEDRVAVSGSLVLSPALLLPPDGMASHVLPAARSLTLPLCAPRRSASRAWAARSCRSTG